MEFTIKVEDKLEVTSRGQTVTFDLTSVPDEKMAEFFGHAALHGLKQAIGDSAASALAASKEKDENRSPEEIALDLMKKKVTALSSGEWTQRREAAPADPIGSRAWKLALDKILGTKGTENAKLYDAYKAGDKDRKLAIRKAVFAKYEVDLRKTAKKQLEDAKKQAETIDLDDLLG